MNVIVRLNESKLIKATNETINRIVREEINKLGDDADLNHIDVSGVTKMGCLFLNKNFNGDISLWNVENVKDMNSIFNSSKFNGDISNWNVEKLVNIGFGFLWSPFSGNLDKWKPRSLSNFYETFHKSPLEGREPIWYKCLNRGLFKSGEDYCDSLKYDWHREGTIFIGRLEMTIELFEGNPLFPTNIFMLNGYTFKN